MIVFANLRRSITIIAILSITAIAAASIYFSVREYQRLYTESAGRDLDALAANLSSDLIPILAGDSDFFEATNILLRLDQYQNTRFAAVMDANRKPVAQYIGTSLTTRANRDAAGVEAERERFFAMAMALAPGITQYREELFVSKRIGDDALPLGTLVIATGLSEALGGSTQRLLSSVVPLAIIATVLIASLIMYLLGRLLNPLQALSEFTQRIRTSRDYSLQSPVTGTREITALTASFNSMMRDIHSEMETNKRQTQLLLEQQEQMERLASFDSLTGLSNRQFLMQTLRRSLATAKRLDTDFCVLFLDLDGFKGINDSYGHETGDKLLVEVGRDIRAELREADLVARLGGDEFLVVLDQQPEIGEAVGTAERLLKATIRPREVDGWKLIIGASIGIATARGAGYELSELMIHADVAMYRSKLAGKGRYTIFEKSMAEDEQRQLAIAHAIAPAIENDDLELHYQPKVSAAGEVVSFEALLRWRNEVFGTTTPGALIAIAEKSGQIRKITAWVLDRCCRDLPRLRQRAGEQVTLALNLSVHDLRDHDLSEQIASAFARHAADPAAFEFEITESAYLENLDRANATFGRLRAMGCSIALDDFGTGYSSLAYLSKIRIDVLKIDKQFVDRLGDSERDSLLTRTIIQMARQLELKTVAEGVETPEQARFLIENGCDMLQGFYFGYPASIDNLELVPPHSPLSSLPLEARNGA